jgi:hypothetical protein
MIRRLGDLARDSDQSAEFVRALLRHHAQGGEVSRRTWRDAQHHWEDTVEAFLHGHDCSLKLAERRAKTVLWVIIRVDELVDSEERLGP